MNNEDQVLHKILQFADNHPLIRAVYLNGSRTNPNITTDAYQDYDVVFVVTEINAFIDDKSWLNHFGNISIMQECNSKEFGWCKDIIEHAVYPFLVMYKEGIRIDFQLQTIEYMQAHYLEDSLTLALLDKDALLVAIDAPNESSYYINSLQEAEYKGSCNEFWWCLNNVAKGLARQQMPYVLKMYNTIIHNELEKMVAWYIQSTTPVKINIGLYGKYFQKHLESPIYELYLLTYTDASYDHIIDAVLCACKLFHLLAINVAKINKFSYNESDEAGSLDYFNKIINQ